MVAFGNLGCEIFFHNTPVDNYLEYRAGEVSADLTISRMAFVEVRSIMI
jgi:hypothetical protein